MGNSAIGKMEVASPVLEKAALKVKATPRQAEPPRISPMMLRWFLNYAPRYTGKHFNNVRVSGAEQFASANHVAMKGGAPIVIYLNHPGWWDPMIAAVVARRFFSGKMHYAAIDAVGLEKYKFFARLGFFGVEQNSAAGARRFLQIGRQILARHNTILWITAQGRFADVRERPLRLAPGLAHLVKHAPHAIIAPMAIEFAFGEERKPDALVRFGDCMEAAHLGSDKDARAMMLEQQLTTAMDKLRESVIHRDYAGFQTILSDEAGVGGVYDLWRKLRARLAGKEFDPAHGSK